jgi:hypothetical protein
VAASSCAVCSAGQYANSPIYATGCISCPTGQYSPQAYQTSCTIAPPGTYIPIAQTQATYVSICGAGLYTPYNTPGDPSSGLSVGNTACLIAPAGYYLTVSTQASESNLVICPVGTYSLGSAVACTPVLAGCFANTTGSTTNCPYQTITGTYISLPGATSIGPYCSQGYYSNPGATACSTCASLSTVPLAVQTPPLTTHWTSSFPYAQYTCICESQYTGNNCEYLGCSSILPGTSLGSILFDADTQLAQYTASFNSTAEQIFDALIYLTNLLFTNVDINGDGNITRVEMLQYLSYLSVYNVNTTAYVTLWCQVAVAGSYCYDNTDSILVTDMYNDAVNNFYAAPYHTFDGSGVEVVYGMTSTYPNPEFSATECAVYDSFSNPTTFKHVETSWSLSGPANAINQVCGYSNGISVSAYTTTSILDGSQTNFVDNIPVTDNDLYKRVYCINVSYKLACGTTAGYQYVAPNCYSPCPNGYQVDTLNPVNCVATCQTTLSTIVGPFFVASSSLNNCTFQNTVSGNFFYQANAVISRNFVPGENETLTSYTCSVGLFYDGTPIDLVPALGFAGVTFSYLDTSITESEVCH